MRKLDSLGGTPEIKGHDTGYWKGCVDVELHQSLFPIKIKK